MIKKFKITLIEIISFWRHSRSQPNATQTGFDCVKWVRKQRNSSDKIKINFIVTFLLTSFHNSRLQYEFNQSEFVINVDK